MKMFEFINDKAGMDSVSPEAFRFNTTWKAGLRLALRFVKVPESYSQQLTGNAKVLWDIFSEYRHAENKTEAGENLSTSIPSQQHRFDILSKAIPAAIIVYFFDSAYREIGDFMLARIIQNQHRFRFPPHHLDPDCWYRDEDGHRITPGCIIPTANIISADDHAIVVKDVLPPKNYFASIEGIDHWVSLNTNFPQWVGDGWAYRVLEVYGTQEEMEHKTLTGE